MNADIKPDQIRLGEHTDFGSITLVFQRDVGDLEVFETISRFTNDFHNTDDNDDKAFLTCSET